MLVFGSSLFLLGSLMDPSGNLCSSLDTSSRSRSTSVRSGKNKNQYFISVSWLLCSRGTCLCDYMVLQRLCLCCMAICYNVVWQVHLSLTWTETDDPVTVKFVQLDRLVEAALVHVHSGSITWEKNHTAHVKPLYCLLVPDSSRRPGSSPLSFPHVE